VPKRGRALNVNILNIAYRKGESITWKGGVHIERGRSVGSKEGSQPTATHTFWIV